MKPKPATDPDSLMTRREVGRLLSASDTLVRALERDGVLPVIRLRSAVRYRRADVLAALAKLTDGQEIKRSRATANRNRRGFSMCRGQVAPSF
jgi:hypothetical protein